MGAPANPPESPPPGILPYLEKYQISWGDFTRRMTRDPDIKRVRSLVVTELHKEGRTWKEMTALTSFGAGQLRGYTRAVGCKASQKNRSENGSRVGRARAGEKKPWLSEQMKEAWAHGKFDFHRGRVRSEEERQKIRDGWAPEKRKAQSRRKVRHWCRPEYRKVLEEFPRSPEERARRSADQAQRMKRSPQKGTRGRGAWVDGEKCLTPHFWVRSSYEVAAVKVLEENPEVLRYEYEPVFKDRLGKTAMPDFRVWVAPDTWKIVEVKAAWVLGMPPDHPKQQGLARYARIAERLSVDFEIWTEQDVLNGYL